MKLKNKTTNLQFVVCLHLPSDTIETFVWRGLPHAAWYLRVVCQLKLVMLWCHFYKRRPLVSVIRSKVEGIHSWLAVHYVYHKLNDFQFVELFLFLWFGSWNLLYSFFFVCHCYRVHLFDNVQHSHTDCWLHNCTCDRQTDRRTDGQNCQRQAGAGRCRAVPLYAGYTVLPPS